MIPQGAILVLLFAILASRFVNWAIYTWAYQSRRIGPWAPAPKGSTRKWADHTPVLGWYLLRREEQQTDQHAKRFWLRPLLIELFFPLLLVVYYGFYVSGGTLPAALRVPAVVATLSTALHWQFGAHFVLFTLMCIATFIDFDEHSIPDFVTVPGTCIGLLGSAFAPSWFPFHATPMNGPNAVLELDAAIPAVWPAFLNSATGLWLAIGILVFWGFALLDRVWITRRGLGKAVQYFLVYLIRRPKIWITISAVTVLLILLTAWCWSNLNPVGRWPLLLSSLLGLAFAAGLTWGVRVSARVGLGVEALGFGDVTLMAMIGTFLGWQPSLLVFFLAPLVAIVFVLVRWVITGEAITPYGPYLCAATVLVLVFWDSLWFGWAARVMILGPELIVGIVASCVLLMGMLLWIWRLVKQVLGIAGH